MSDSASACYHHSTIPAFHGMTVMKTFKDIDWTRWQPREHATLLFVLRDNEILLIHKKRGLGAGKINGPGGRIEPGETAMEGAVREVREEVGVIALDVKHVGVLRFQFADGFSIQGEVFTANGCEGEPVETDEAIPHWFQADKLPYDRMWADDRVWMPHLLAGQRFDGRFLFDGDTMLAYELDVVAGEREP